jgi:phosphoribosylanthranilate isomerase
VIELVNRSGVKAAQLHGRETPAQTAEVAASIRWVIKAFAAGSDELARADRYGTPMVLVDAPSPGSGKVFDWDLAGEAPGGLQLILAGGLTPENVADGVVAVEPWGVDVSSGVERAPGRKDALKVKRFIENARAAAPRPYLGPDELPYDWADE